MTLQNKLGIQNSEEFAREEKISKTKAVLQHMAIEKKYDSE